MGITEIILLLSRPSLNLQKEGLSLADASIHLEATKSVLQAYARDYGNAEVKSVLALFKPQLRKAGIDDDEGQVLEEWQCMKTMVLKKFPDKLKDKSLRWPQVLRALGNDQGQISLVMDLLQTFPPTS
ncbi:hypothetical protein MAR_006717, partial [Mya arenaria]